MQKFVVKDNRANARFYYETALALGTQALSVPGFVFCRQVLIGYDSAESTGAEIAAALEQCHEQRLANPSPVQSDGERGAAGEPATSRSASRPARPCTCPSSARSTRRRFRCRC